MVNETFGEDPVLAAERIIIAHVHRVLTWADHISGDGVLTTQEFQRGLKARGLSLGSRAMSELMRVRHHMLLLL
jgi:hypothetical protein